MSNLEVNEILFSFVSCGDILYKLIIIFVVIQLFVEYEDNSDLYMSDFASCEILLLKQGELVDLSQDNFINTTVSTMEA